MQKSPLFFHWETTALRNMIGENFRMRKVTSNAEKESCEIIFIVDKDGSMTEVKASGSNESFNREAERAILQIKQKWIPAELNGKKVRYKFRIPLAVAFDRK